MEVDKSSEKESKSKKRKSNRSCFVPNCTTGYKSNIEKKTLFNVPKNLEILEKWKTFIPRKDRVLGEYDVVCEKHFKEECIERSYRHIINGREVLLPRGKPILRDGALPTEYPELPSYFTKKVSKKRTPKCREPDAKKTRMNENDNTDDHIFSNPNLPSEYWTKITSQEQTNIYAFALWSNINTDMPVHLILNPERLVVVKELDDKTACSSTYINGCTTEKDKILNNVADLQNLLLDVTAKKLCEGAGNLNEFSEVTLNQNDFHIQGNVLRHKICKGVVNINSNMCLRCKCARKKLLDKRSRRNRKKPGRKLNFRTKYRSCQKTKNDLKLKVKNLKQCILKFKSEMKEVAKKGLEESVKLLPHKQALAITECIKVSKRKKKNSRGINYSREWILESIIMKMKSPRLYEHIRLNKIMALPGKTCLQNALRHFKAGFGFNMKMFSILKEKTKLLENSDRHGNLMFDELKLSECLKMDLNGVVQGYVDYGPDITPENEKSLICNHGLVLLFQPFRGSWVQIIGVFGTHGNVKGHVLAKLLTEAVIHAENAGLFVDVVTGDGASWNRAMWKEFGIGESKKKINKKSKQNNQENNTLKYKVPHPCDSNRSLHFISDFPHLLKCLRNRFLSKGYRCPTGEIRPEFLKEAWKQDQYSTVKLKVMPKLSYVHLHPNAFEKMRVNIAFQLFGDEVIKGLFYYADQVSVFGDSKPTVDFVKKINSLIKAMTSRTAKTALREGSSKKKELLDFYNYIVEWEKFSEPAKGLGYLSKSTSIGFKVSLQSTLSLLSYLSSELKFNYLLTSRLSQDKIENMFSIVRQSKGCNDHPTPTEFLTIIECLTFYNLARPPKCGNSQPSIVSALMDPSQPQFSGKQILQTMLDDLIECGKLTEAYDALGDSTSTLDVAIQHSDSRLIYYTSGYIVRKFFRLTKCEECRLQLSSQKNATTIEESKYTKEFDLGGLMYPSQRLFEFISSLENNFTESISTISLHRDITFDIIENMRKKKFSFVGCKLHKYELSKRIVKFYILTRMHFYLKSDKHFQEQKRKRLKLLKLRRNV